MRVLFIGVNGPIFVVAICGKVAAETCCGAKFAATVATNAKAKVPRATRTFFILESFFQREERRLYPRYKNAQSRFIGMTYIALSRFRYNEFSARGDTAFGFLLTKYLIHFSSQLIKRVTLPVDCVRGVGNEASNNNRAVHPCRRST